MRSLAGTSPTLNPRAGATQPQPKNTLKELAAAFSLTEFGSETLTAPPPLPDGSHVTRLYDRTHRPITARLTVSEHKAFSEIAAKHGVAPATFAGQKLREIIAAELHGHDFEDAKLAYGEAAE